MLINKINLFKRRQSVFAVSALIILACFFCLPSSALAQSQWTTNGNNINNTNTGNVGVGTTTPTDKLEVSATSTNNIGIRVTNPNASGTYPYGVMLQGGSYAWGVPDWPNAFVIEGTANGGLVLDSYVAPLKLQAGRVTRMTIDHTSGNVGIGTSSPTNRLTVIGDGSGIAQIGTIGCAGNYVGITLPLTVAPGGCSNYTFASSPTDQTLYINRPSGNSIRFRENNGYTPDQLVIASGGNVGIGTTTPAAKLDVNGNANITGNITVTGNINAKYQDVAEWVSATHAMPAGTVVVLNPAQSNQVMACAKSYDTRVAGVVSTMPGIVLGEAGPDKVMVATTGRVKIKVDATRAPIYVGDLLVTSDKEGVAMKSVPVNINGIEFHRPGTLIGKALEPLEKGTGEILVLLSLQ